MGAELLDLLEDCRSYVTPTLSTHEKISEVLGWCDCGYCIHVPRGTTTSPQPGAKAATAAGAVESAAHTPLFATSTGKPYNRREVLTLVKRIAALAGLDDPQGMHPHVGRHTYITEARRLNYGGDDIQHSVGHRDRATTDKYGTHILNLKKSPAYGVAARFTGS